MRCVGGSEAATEGSYEGCLACSELGIEGEDLWRFEGGERWQFLFDKGLRCEVEALECEVERHLAWSVMRGMIISSSEIPPCWKLPR